MQEIRHLLEPLGEGKEGLGGLLKYPTVNIGVGKILQYLCGSLVTEYRPPEARRRRRPPHKHSNLSTVLSTCSFVAILFFLGHERGLSPAARKHCQYNILYKYPGHGRHCLSRRVRIVTLIKRKNCGNKEETNSSVTCLVSCDTCH